MYYWRPPVFVIYGWHSAEWQHIVYNEWLPVVLGQRFMFEFGIHPLSEGYSNSYNPTLDPRITNAFAAAAFRIGHTMISDVIM